MRPITACLLALVLITSFGPGRTQENPPSPAPATSFTDSLPGGELRAIDDSGSSQACPLKHTEVHAEITGRVAQVRLSQVFQNPFDHPIEAIYIFPLPRLAAVDDMEIRIGDRTIRGEIKKREEARALYDEARRSGRTAALLDQERPNIFTQSVANIMPGEEIVVTLRYFDLLPYESGSYEFVFPMVVGPRFIPGEPIVRSGTGRAPDTTEVPDASRITPFFGKPYRGQEHWVPDGKAPNTVAAPDASRITPPALEPGQRSGHDVSLEIDLHAGLRLYTLDSPTHKVDIEQAAPEQARIRLRQEDSIPNKDFVLRYRIDGAAPGWFCFRTSRRRKGIS
jgi:Ca-activated chloride channel homolog